MPPAGYQLGRESSYPDRTSSRAIPPISPRARGLRRSGLPFSGCSRAIAATAYDRRTIRGSSRGRSACVRYCRGSRGRRSRSTGACVGRIGPGWLVLLGVARGDTDADAAWIAEKVLNLRAFEDDQGKMNRSVAESAAASWSSASSPCWATAGAAAGPASPTAAEPAEAERLYLRFAELLAAVGPRGRHRRLPRDDEGRTGQRRAGDVPAGQPQGVLTVDAVESPTLTRERRYYR